MKFIFTVLILVITNQASAQLKTDVLVLGATASGTACAIQAARSGVKAILIEPSDKIISVNEPNLNIPAFKSGIWCEWKNHSDSSKTTPRNSLETIIKKVKNLQFFKNVKVLSINYHTNNYTVKIILNGQQQEIKTKILVDASENVQTPYSQTFNTLKIKTKKPIKSFLTYTLQQQQTNKLYRTTVAAGFGADSSQIFAIPVGAIIPTWIENLIVINQLNAYNGINSDSFNLALRLNLGQAAGTLAAYSPFFKTPILMANVRILQSEVLNYKGQILPIIDVSPQDSAYKAIQQCIISSVLKFDFKTGMFYPNSLVNANDVQPALCDLFTRAKIWYAENPNKVLNLENTVSLFSFITTREAEDINREVFEKWKIKYGIILPFDIKKPLTRKQFAVLVNNYLQPYKIRVDLEGNFLK